MRRSTYLVLPLVLVAFTGCLKRSHPVVLHTLRPLLLEEHKAASPAPPLALEVMPVQIPDMLQRPQIVSVQGPERLGLSEIHRWGNPLEKEIQRVVVENLEALLGGDTVVAYPLGERVKAPYRLSLEVQALNGQPGGMLRLDATWMLIRPAGGPAILLRRVHLQEPVQDSGTDGLVAAHSRILETLSRGIAAELKGSPAYNHSPN